LVTLDIVVLGEMVAPVPPTGADAEYKSALGKAEFDGTPVPKFAKLLGAVNPVLPPTGVSPVVRSVPAIPGTEVGAPTSPEPVAVGSDVADTPDPATPSIPGTGVGVPANPDPASPSPKPAPP
jgi:hypothetical protein